MTEATEAVAGANVPHLGDAPAADRAAAPVRVAETPNRAEVKSLSFFYGE